MKEPITVPSWGYTWNEETRKIEAHRVMRYGILDGCSAPSMTCIGPDGKAYHTSPGMLKDTVAEVLEDEERNSIEDLASIGDALLRLHKQQVATLNRLALLGKLLKEQK